MALRLRPTFPWPAAFGNGSPVLSSVAFPPTCRVSEIGARSEQDWSCALSAGFWPLEYIYMRTHGRPEGHMPPQRNMRRQRPPACEHISVSVHCYCSVLPAQFTVDQVRMQRGCAAVASILRPPGVTLGVWARDRRGRRVLVLVGFGLRATVCGA